MEGISVIVGLIIGLSIGGAGAFYIAKLRFQKPAAGKSDEDIQHIIALESDIARKQEHIKNLEEKVAANAENLKKQSELLSAQFESLANKILDQKSEKFTDQNKKNIDSILTPLKERIEKFEKSVEDKYVKEVKGRSELAQQIKSLTELNHQMSEEAQNLTRALKGDSKKQGDWGEIQLELILEKAGLIKDVHYSTQTTFRDNDGKLKRPDVIIQLPEDKCIIVDSKVSLVSYEAYVNAEDDVEQLAHLKAHIGSIEDHIKDLGSKNYTEYEINTPDYVLLYVPIEPALMAALQADNELYLKALDKNVVLVTTSTLLATMRTVSSIWQHEDQKRHVLRIAEESGKLYDKFVGFTDDLIAVGKQLDTTQKSYKSAMNKMSEGTGNLIGRAENIKKLGAKASKNLNEHLVQRSKGTDDETFLGDSEG